MKKTRRADSGRLLAIASACVAVVSFGTTVSLAKDDAAYARHVAAASQAAGEDLKYLTHLCGDNQGEFLRSLPSPPSPFKIFDNVYYIINGFVSSIAINTSDGIILIDALNNAAEADKDIIGGLRTVGLNPNNIKYVIATHGHADHYGGMQELKNRIPGVRLIMAPADWEFAALRASLDPKAVKPPAKDLSASDGQKLTLGDTTITIYLTPGHTPGTLSLIIPAKDHGTPHVISLFGGSTMYADPHSLAEFKVSLDRFSEIEKAAHVEGRLNTHPGWTDSNDKIVKMRANPNAPNPFLETKEYMARYDKVREECRQAMIARIP